MPTTSAPTADLPDVAYKVREQVIQTVQKSQKASVDAASTWIKAASALPHPELPAIPGLPTVNVAALVTYAFDFATELLTAQRAYASELTEILVPTAAA